ncbi:MAG: NADPH-dependent F420 reductase [Candidatus Micrarchaeaceae archaeon]
MKIGIIGSGDVGKALASGFAALGNEVVIGSRDPNNEKIKTAVEKMGKLACSGTFEEAAKFGDIIVIATLWVGTENAIKLADQKNFSGKIVIDVTNPLDFSEGAPKLMLGHNNSAGEQVQKWLPESHVVKAFNIVGNAHMFKPEFKNGPPDMFYCGNDENAKKEIAKIIHEFGWANAIDLGDIKSSRLLEPLAMVWITYGLRTSSWNHAFKLLHK